MVLGFLKSKMVTYIVVISLILNMMVTEKYILSPETIIKVNFARLHTMVTENILGKMETSTMENGLWRI